MGRRVEDFMAKMEFGSLRCYNDGKDFIMPGGYKIVKSAYAPAGTFAALKQDGVNVQFENFCLMVMEAGPYCKKNIYELDVVDYELNGERRLGVVTYAKERYMYVIKDVQTQKRNPLHLCVIHDSFGNLMSDPSLIDQTLESLQESNDQGSAEAEAEVSPAAEQAAPAETNDPSYAALNEPVPGFDGYDPPSPRKKPLTVHAYAGVGKNDQGVLNWIFHLAKTNSTRTKSERGPFNVPGQETLYYIFGSAIIALQEISRADSIVLHIQSESLVSAINEGRFFSMDPQTWTYKNGRVPSDTTKLALKELQDLLRLLNADLRAEYCDYDGVYNLAKNAIS